MRFGLGYATGLVSGAIWGAIAMIVIDTSRSISVKPSSWFFIGSAVGLKVPGAERKQTRPSQDSNRQL